MSLDQASLSFESRQAPTPTRTPTSPSFADFLRTPKFDSSFYEGTTAAWDPSRTGNQSPSSNRTPRIVAFGTPSLRNAGPASSPHVRHTVRMLGAEFAANTQHLLATPEFADLQVDPPDHLPHDFVPLPTTTPGQLRRPHNRDAATTTSSSMVDATDTNAPMLQETHTTPSSADAMQTPPPTSVSASKRQAQQASRLDISQLQTPRNPPARSTEQVLQGQLGASLMDESPAGFPALDPSPGGFDYSLGLPLTASMVAQQQPTASLAVPELACLPGATLTDPMQLPSAPAAQTNMSSVTFELPSQALQRAALTSNKFTTQDPSASNGHKHQHSKGVDPTLLFSSPSKALEMLSTTGRAPAVLDRDIMQPYAYQEQEALRDQAQSQVSRGKRRRKPSIDSPAVRLAVETLRDEHERPELRRSFTDSALSRPARDPVGSRPSSKQGCSSPLKRIHDIRRQQQRAATKQTSIALTIDEHGRARAEKLALADQVMVDASGKADEGAMDVDGSSDGSDVASSSTSSAEAFLTSFGVGRPGIGPQLGHFRSSSRSHSHSNSAASLRSLQGMDLDSGRSIARSRPASVSVSGLFGLQSRPMPASFRRGASTEDRDMTIDPDTLISSPVGTLDDESDTAEDAEAELRKMRRPLSVFSQRSEQPATARASRVSPRMVQEPAFSFATTSSMRRTFQPPPPPVRPVLQTIFTSTLAAEQHGLSKISPTTITDPDSMTPQSALSRASAGVGAHEPEKVIRCVCQGARRADGGPLVQCTSCRRWLHYACIGVDPQRTAPLSPYTCLFCSSPIQPQRSSTHFTTPSKPSRTSNHAPAPTRQASKVGKTSTMSRKR